MTARADCWSQERHDEAMAARLTAYMAGLEATALRDAMLEEQLERLEHPGASPRRDTAAGADLPSPRSTGGTFFHGLSYGLSLSLVLWALLAAALFAAVG